MKILFFSPYAFITVHSIPEAIVAEALKERGHDITFVNCDGVLSRHCISMSAMGLSPQAPAIEKELTCVICRKRRNLILNEFGFSSVVLDKFITCDEELSIQNIILNVSPENFTEFTLMDIPVGRYALYEFLINNKLNTISLNNAEWEEYKIHLYNTIKAAYGCRRILEEIKPDVVATLNPLYSVNHIFCALAAQHEIPHYALVGGSHMKYRYSVMTPFKGFHAILLTTRTKAWKRLLNMPISPRQVQTVGEHVEVLLNATDPWVYSIASRGVSSVSLRKFFGISDDKYVLLAIMASADERFAASMIDAMPPFVEPMFPTQIDWINGLIEFVRKRDDIFLIIRAHPREFPNKREGVLSKQVVELQKLFVNLPNNICVNWPQDQISLHDLIKITDVGLNSTSTAGIELGMFGAPVVLYDSDQLFSYPAEINYVALNQEDYYQKIDIALKEGWSFENVRKTFRWLSYKFDHVEIDISDGFKVSDVIEIPSFFYNVRNYLMRRLGGNSYLEERLFIEQLKKRTIPVKNSELLSVAIERNMESHLDLAISIQGGQPTHEEETVAISNQVRKLFQLITVKDDTTDAFINKVERVLSGC